MAEPNNNQPQEPNTQPQGGTEGQQTEPQPTPAVDYDKIQQMLNGTLEAKEKTALANYFKQQGLSQEEAEAAIADFKKHKKESQPDIDGMRNQMEGYRKTAVNAQIESKVYQLQADLDIPTKSVPYLLRMLDKNGVIGEDGVIDEAKLKEACDKVLNDIPALKNQKKSQAGAGFKIGGDGGQTQQDAKEAALRKAFGLK